jgi:hypothetical protein
MHALLDTHTSTQSHTFRNLKRVVCICVVAAQPMLPAQDFLGIFGAHCSDRVCLGMLVAPVCMYVCTHMYASRLYASPIWAMYMYIYIYIYIYIYTHTRTHIHVYIHTYSHSTSFVRVCMHLPRKQCTCTHTHTYIYFLFSREIFCPSLYATPM